MAYINKIVVNGQEVNANQLEGIQDASGNNRFVSFNGSTNPSDVESVIYDKATLSGSHFMAVLFCKLAVGTNWAGKFLDSFTIPEWIGNKIFPIDPDNYNIVTAKKLEIIDATGIPTGEYIECALRKTSSTSILISASTMPTGSSYGALATGGYVRFQFDLVID